MTGTINIFSLVKEYLGYNIPYENIFHVLIAKGATDAQAQNAIATVKFTRGAEK